MPARVPAARDSLCPGVLCSQHGTNIWVSGTPQLSGVPASRNLLGAAAKIPLFLLACCSTVAAATPSHTQAVHDQHMNSRGSDHPCPMLRVWKQSILKVPGNGDKNMLHACSVEHAMLCTQLFQQDSSNQPLQAMGYFFPAPVSTSQTEPQATGGFSPILLQGQCSQLSHSFWWVLQHLAILKPQDKFPNPCLQQKA